MNLKKKAKAGQCRAMRCKEADNGSGFCDRHEKEWWADPKNRPKTVEEAEDAASSDPIEAAGMKSGLAHADVRAAHEAVAIEVKAEVESQSPTIQEYVTLVPQLEILTDQDMALANEILAEVKDKIEGLEARRKTVSKPLNDVLKTYNAWFKKPMDALKSVEKQLKDKIAGALLAAKNAQDEALAAIEASGGEAAADIVAVAHGQELLTQPDNVSVREVWDLEIVDASAVPRDFCDPNPARLKAHAVATNGAEVAGVRFFKRPIVSQRAGK